MTFDLHLVPNLIGVFAVAFGVFIKTRRNNDLVLKLLAVNVCIWALHYYLLGSDYGAATSLYNAFVLVTAFRIRARGGTTIAQRLALATALNLVNVADVILFWHGPKDLVMLGAITIVFYSDFILYGRHMRYGFIGSNVLVITFALLIGSVPLAVNAALAIAAHAIGITRMLRHERQVIADNPAVATTRSRWMVPFYPGIHDTA